ncbi:MAG: DUF5946 family protein [Thermoanaerobaculia bacterium]
MPCWRITERDAYEALCAYTLSRGDPGFIHQHVVDAFAAQRADAASKPIGVTFALVGLFLFVERGWSGKRVQRAHMRLARRPRSWPTLPLPPERGSMTAADVMAAPAGAARDDAVRAWCAEVWAAFAGSREAIVALLGDEGLL